MCATSAAPELKEPTLTRDGHQHPTREDRERKKIARKSGGEQFPLQIKLVAWLGLKRKKLIKSPAKEAGTFFEANKFWASTSDWEKRTQSSVLSLIAWLRMSHAEWIELCKVSTDLKGWFTFAGQKSIRIPKDQIPSSLSLKVKGFHEEHLLQPLYQKITAKTWCQVAMGNYE